MGIKDLYTFLKQNDIEEMIYLSDLHGMTIAIDLPIIENSFTYKASKIVINNEESAPPYKNFRNNVLRVYMELLSNFVNKLKNNNMNIIFVIDGEKRDLKVDTVSERKSRIDKYFEKFSEKSGIDNVSKDMTLMEKIEFYESHMLTLEFHEDLLSEIRKLYTYTSKLSYKQKMKSYEYIKNNLDCIIYKAEYDAEQLCCKLCRDGEVDCVLSTDGDCLAYRCPLLIKMIVDEISINPSHGGVDYLCKVYRYEKIIENLQFDNDQFLNFCIMLGCDFNKRIRGVGPKTSFKLIKEHKNIQNLPEKYKEKKSVLNFEECLNIFLTEDINYDII